MSLISVFVEASVTCPTCHNPVHVSRAAQSILCTRCQNPVELSVDQWTSMLSEEIAEAAQMEEGTGQQSTQFGGLQVRLKYGRLNARCAKCKNPFPNLVPSEMQGQIFCPACGTKTGARQAPAWIKKLHPAIVAIVGEAPGADEAKPMAGVEPVVIHCFSCGGKLSCDGTTRQPNCTFCGTENFLPDQLWLRLHPAETVSDWFLLLDLEGAVGVLPEDCWTFCGIGYSPTGGAIVVYEDSDDTVFIDGLDGNGFVAWRNKDLKLSDEVKVAVGPMAQYVILADEENHLVQYIDPTSGKPLWRVQGPEDVGDDDKKPLDPRPIEIDEYKPFAVDADGTIVVVQYGDDESQPLLTRYSGGGQFLPMWTQHQAKNKWDYDVDWGNLRDGQVIVPYEAKMTIGNDGNLYLLHEELTNVAIFDRTGRLLQNRQLQQPPGFDEVRAFGVDSAGTIYALCEISAAGKSGWAHVVRIFAGQQPELLAGPGVPGSAPLGEDDEKMSVAPNGNMYIAHDLDSIRILDGYGKLLWRSHTTAKRDRENE